MEMSAILVVLTILGGFIGTIFLIGIVGKITGTTDILSLILQIMGQIFSAVRTFFSTMVSAAPTPLKIVFFLVLFWLFGSLIFGLTIGSTRVCNMETGVVYKGSILDGFAVSLLPSAIIEAKVASHSLSENTATIDGFQNLNFRSSPLVIQGDHLGKNDTYWIMVPASISDHVDRGEKISGRDDLAIDNWFYKICYNIPQGVCYFREKACAGSIETDFETDYSDRGKGSTRNWSLLYDVQYSMTVAGDSLRVRITKRPALKNNKYSLDDCSTNSAYDSYGFENMWISDLDESASSLSRENLWTRGPGLLYNAAYLPLVWVRGPGGWDFTPDFGSGVRTKEAYIDENLKEESYDKSKFISFKCVLCKEGDADCTLKYSESEELRMFGIPIFDIRVIGAIVFLTFVFWIIGFTKHK